jgi:hypothetical protein
MTVATTLGPWRSTPRASRLIFLLAVFFVFAGCGFAYDSIDLGRQPPLRFAISVLVQALFAVCYAGSGVALRGKFWKAFVPLFALQFAVMNFLMNRLPNGPEHKEFNVVETTDLRARLAFDGSATMISVVLGYVGFVYVSVTESRRYTRSQTERAKLEGEMAAAREVQRVMVPDEPPPVHGYTVESVYHPAAEVGGDFFQVIPLSSGHTLAVIGDVSGKGLRAAMIVSMIVGMLGTVSDFTQEPAEILAELNRRLCGRTQGGFATCLAVRIEGNGRLLLANAGHPPPYLNGEDTPFAGSLPLGLVESAVYEQSNLDLYPGDQFVLLTDGVAEAQNAQAELFGFPRIQSLLRQRTSAKALAELAQQHGQNDDLTVITLTRNV